MLSRRSIKEEVLIGETFWHQVLAAQCKVDVGDYAIVTSHLVFGAKLICDIVFKHH